MQSTLIVTSLVLRRLTLAGAFVALAPASRAAAQQDTTKHPTTGMPGMQMPTGTATKATRSARRKAVRVAKLDDADGQSHARRWALLGPDDAEP